MLCTTQSWTCVGGSGRDSVVCSAPPRAGLVVMAKAKTLCTQSRTCGEGSGRDSVVCSAPPRAGLVVL